MREKKVCIGGRALREAPHVRHGGVAQAPVIGAAVPPTGQVPLKGTSAHKKLGMLGIVAPQGLNVVKEAPEWEEIEMAVDSGASASVVNEEQLNGIETLEGDAKKKGGFNFRLQTAPSYQTWAKRNTRQCPTRGCVGT